MSITKRQKKIAELGIEKKPYSLEDALGLFSKYKETCGVKFDETVEISCRLGVDPRHSDQMVRGAIPLPAGTGKAVKIAVFTVSDAVDGLKDCGADIVGSDELADSIKKGAAIEFDKCVATPTYMPALASKLGKILGPKGLMPNPKLGTVTNDVKTAVAELKAGKVEFRTEKSGIVHAGIGKLSFESGALNKNISAFLKALSSARPSAAKGEYFRSIFIATTMGPSIELDKKQFIA